MPRPDSIIALLRRCRRRLAGPELSAGASRDGLREQTRRFTRGQALVYAFYAFLLYLAIAQMTEIPIYAELSTFHPLWPVQWLGPHDPIGAVRGLFFFFLGTSLFAAAVPGWRTARVLAFAGLLEYVALKNSYGKIGHSMHLPLLVALLLIFLPRGWQRPAGEIGRNLRQRTLLVFWLCAAAILLTYTMSGLGKLGGAIYQLARFQPNAFAPGGLSALIAQRLLQTGSHSLLGAWIIQHPWLTWPAFPFAVYLELFSVVVAFRPAVARPWAAALVSFHVVNYFALTIAFPPSCFLLALFFFCSPFEPGKASWRATIFSVPLAGDLIRLLFKATGHHPVDVKTK